MNLDKHKQFEQAIAQLYTTFACYPARRTMWACSCCVKHEEIVALTTRPLRSLSGDDLGRYTFKAMTTWGDSEDFRYFLPRLLELCMLDPETHFVDRETICRKLKYGHWEKWPQEERQAIIAYLLASWQLLLTHESYALNCSASDYLEALSQALEDLSPFLQAWRQSNEATALQALAVFVNENRNELGSSCTLKWRSGSPVTKQQVITWLLESETRQWLEDGFFRYAEEDFAEDLAAAADILFFQSKAGW
jgi:hypothetical protein